MTRLNGVGLVGVLFIDRAGVERLVSLSGSGRKVARTGVKGNEGRDGGRNLCPDPALGKTSEVKATNIAKMIIMKRQILRLFISASSYAKISEFGSNKDLCCSMFLK